MDKFNVIYLLLRRMKILEVPIIDNLIVKNSFKKWKKERSKR